MATITIIKDDKMFKADVNQAKQLLQEIFEIDKPKNLIDEFNDRLDRKGTAKFIGRSYQTVNNWCKQGGAFAKLEKGEGRKGYFLKCELIAFLNNKSH